MDLESQRKRIYELFSSNSYLLIILDACRYDALAKLGAEPVESVGSCTPEWIKGTFTKPLDAVLVTGNPWYAKLNSHRFFKSVEYLFIDFWDSELETVHPRWVKAIAMKYVMKGENLIAHFVQPHAPIVNEKWLRQHPEMRMTARMLYMLLNHNIKVRRLYKEGYFANLQYVLRYATSLAKMAKSRGYRVVITSDHGELFGTYDPKSATYVILKRRARRRILSIPFYLLGIWRMAGHPSGYRHPDLITVPWIEI